MKDGFVYKCIQAAKMEKEGEDGCVSPPWPAAQGRLKHLPGSV